MNFLLNQLGKLGLNLNNLRTGSAVLVNKVFGVILGYLFILQVSRKYGAAIVGAYTICYTILQVISNLGRCGTDIYLLQRSSVLFPSKNSSLIGYFN